MPRTKPPTEFEVLGFRRRGFSSTNTPTTGAVSIYGRNALAVDGSTSTGQVYAGYTPTIYAAPADAGTGDGSSEANAMDLPTALSTAAEGAIIGVLPGTYTGTAGGGRFNVAWTTTYSGTIGNPIKIVAKYQAVSLSTPGSNGNRSELAHTGSSAYNDANSSPVFGPSSRNYVEWYGFYVDERTSYSHADTGPVVLYNTTGGKVINCYIQGGTATWTDNHCGIRSEEVDNAEISNNYIRDIQTSGTPNGVNVVGIQTYDSRDLLITHNTIADCRSGIFVKGIQNGVTSNDQHNITMTYNRITGISHTGIAAGMIDSGTNIVAYNLIDGAAVFGLRLRVDATVSRDGTPIVSDDWTVHHNTIDVSDSTNLVGVIENGTTDLWGTVVRDNLIVVTNGANARPLYNSGTRTANYPTLSYNRYWSSTGTPAWNKLSVNYNTIGDWQTSGAIESNSSYGDPSFVSRGTDWKLSGSSDALTASSTGGPVGCYLTGSEEIGVEAA